MDGIFGGASAIVGTLSGINTISGELSTPIYVDVDVYDGTYDVSPDFAGVTLNTKNKTLKKDISVRPIQVESVSNIEGGRTVYIGGII